MTQPQRNEERLLDYLYEELDADARAQVDAELSSDPTLRDELDSYRRVRGAFAGLPKVAQSTESTQRMTALLMQQAAQHAATSKPAGATEPEAGGGKLVAFRPRSLRRVFTNPAAGIFAAAAAALLWVAVKSQNPTPPAEPMAKLVTTTTTSSAPPIVTATPTLAGPANPAEGGEKKSAAATKSIEPAEPQVWAQLSRNATSDTLAQAPELARPDPAPTAAPAKPMAPRVAFDKAKNSLDGKLMALNEGRGSVAKGAVAKTELANSRADRALDDSRKEAEAKPPQAPSAGGAPSSPSGGDGDGSVRGAIAQTQARRNQRVIEELANQELGSMPAPAGSSARPSGPAPPPAAAPPAEPEHYAQNDSVDRGGVADDESKTSNRVGNVRSRDQSPSAGYAQNAAPSQAAPAQRVANVDSGHNNLPLLAAVQEYLRQGRCAEANAALVRVEQSFPATRGLPEARAQWQRSCAGNNNQPIVPSQERQLLAQPNESQQTLPMAAPAPINRELMKKRAAPARAKPAPAKAADSAASY